MAKSLLSPLAADAFSKMDGKKDPGAKSLSDYHAAQKAEYAKTAKLRELRLAKEAAERDAKLAADQQSPPKKTTTKTKKPAKVSEPKVRRSISWGR